MAHVLLTLNEPLLQRSKARGPLGLSLTTRKSNLSSVCLLICRVFGLAGKHDRPADLNMLTFEQI
jgi:hypothetical protein